MEVRRQQPSLARGGRALRLHLRRHFPAGDRVQGPQPRHRVVFDRRQRMAGHPCRIRALARSFELRCIGTAEGEAGRNDRGRAWMTDRSIRAIPFFLALAWGLNWPSVKIALSAFPPFTLRMIGLGMGALLLLLIAIARGK